MTTKSLPSSLVQDFLTYLSFSYSQEERSSIEKACHLAETAHQGQLRKSGEPYISHPLAVAKILNDLHLDASTLIAGILHDTVEDTSVNLAQIEKEFGKTVAHLVDGVTQLPDCLFESADPSLKEASAQKQKKDVHKQAENFKKIILSMAKDIRVILVKLADRLSNMRTLEYMPIEKQRKKAQETLDIYAPLANRLGIYWMKEELEDLCFRYLDFKNYTAVLQRLEIFETKKLAELEKNRTFLYQIFQEYNLHAQLEIKRKHLYTLYKKIERRGSFELETMDDLFYLQILVENITECYKCLGIIHSHQKPLPGKFKDYIAMPKVNGYQALHTCVLGEIPGSLEIQIRTHDMQAVCYFGITAHSSLQEAPSKISTEWIQHFLEWNKDAHDPNEFLNTLKIDLFPTDIFAFTPKGDLKQLPYGSTLIDFAYTVHTTIGNHCIGGKINGKPASLKSKIKSGDRIEILTSEEAKPSIEWLKFAKSSRAKTKIARWFRQQKENETPSLETPISLSAEMLEKKEARLARCCYPIPGEEIVITVQAGHQKVVHTRTCQAMKRDQRVGHLAVWDLQNRDPNLLFIVQIQIETTHTTELFAVCATLFGYLKNQIQKVFLEKKTGLFHLEVSDKQDLSKILQLLEKMPQVSQAFKTM